MPQKANLYSPARGRPLFSARQPWSGSLFQSKSGQRPSVRQAKLHSNIFQIESMEPGPWELVQALACSTIADIIHRVSHVGPGKPVQEAMDKMSKLREFPLPMGTLSPWMRRGISNFFLDTLFESWVADCPGIVVLQAGPKPFQGIRAHHACLELLLVPLVHQPKQLMR